MEKFGLSLPLRNQYFLFRVGQNFSEKGGKTVTNAEACLLDWPITELGKEQAINGSHAFLDTRGLVWPAWKRINNLALLSGNQGGKEALRKLKKSVFSMWSKYVTENKLGAHIPSSESKLKKLSADDAKQNEGKPPAEIDVYASDFKAAKQVATVVTEVWSQDEGVSAVNLRFTEQLRERSLGSSMEHGGFDGCGRDELSQIWALDNLDGSHRLGGIESCEQVLSRCMKILREIEASTVSKQVVLISHCDVCHIFQTIFCSLKPGAHRLLPALNPGEVRELKFQTLAGGDEDGDEEDQAVDEGRSLKVFLSSSVGLDRHRDAVIAEAFPRIADACARRCVAFSYIDLRLSVDDPYGLGEHTVANRLKTLENSNVFVCLMDPEKEQVFGVDDQMLNSLSRDEMLRKVCEELDEGEGGAAQQFAEMHSVLREMLDAFMEREGDAEKARLSLERPGLIMREVEKLRASRKEFARDQLYGSFSGLRAVMDVYDHIEDWLDRGKAQGERDGEASEMADLLVEMCKDFEDGKVRDFARGVLGLVLKKVRTDSVGQFRQMVGLLEKKSHAIRRANEKYPWVGRWAESSLLEIEVRYATLSSVPAIKKDQTFYFAAESGKAKGSVTVEDGEGGRGGTADGSRKGTPGQAGGKRVGTSGGGRRGSILKTAGEGSRRSRGGTGTSQRTQRVDQRRALVDALAAEDVVPQNYNGAAMAVDLVVEEFSRLLDELYPEDAVPVNLSDERHVHLDIARERDELYVPEARLAKAVSAHAQGDANALLDMGVYMGGESLFQALIVVGEPGSGKGALLAHTGLHHRKVSREDLVVMHFAASCFDATNPVRMMHRFVLEMLGAESPSRLGIKGSDPAYTARMFMRAMEIMHFRYQGKKNVVLLIDSVDKLSESETNIDLWLPHVFPSTVRMVVSTCDGPCFHRLAARQNSPSVRIPTLKPEARAAICASYLARIGRVFSMDQMNTAVGAPFTCSPLFLTGLAQQCRLCYSRLLDEDSSPAPVIRELDRSRDVRELYGNMLSELDIQYGGTEESGYSDLVQTCLTLLWASRRGLAQSELYEAVRQTCPAPFERLLELLAELKQRVVLTHGRLRLFHHQFVLAVERRYLGKYFDDDVTDLMVDGHLLLSRYFETLPAHYIRKVEEYPYQLCHVITSYPEEAEELESYILRAEVFREMADSRFHADLCGYWKVVCADKGNEAEIAGKYMGSFQQYVAETGDKGSVPELCFSVGFLLEDLGQYRSAKRVYQEALRVMQNLSLMHPMVLQSLRPNLQAQLFELRPKVLLHLGSSLIKAGLLKEAEATLGECRGLVMSLADYAWARADTHTQMAILAVEMGDFYQAESLFKLSLQAAESNDLMMQDDIMERLMNLYRSNALIYLQQANHKKALRLLQKEQETLRSAKRMWTQYTYIDPSTSRPPSAIVTLIESAKNAMTATFTSFKCFLEYDPLLANQPTNLTVSFVWRRAIEEGDDFSLQLKQMRAGGDRQSLTAEGADADCFDFFWVELTRTLVFVAKKGVAASHPVKFTIPASERIRLPVKQAGDNRVLATEATVNVIKCRVRAERVRGGGDDSRPGTGSTVAASRPGTGAGSRPGSRGGLRGFLINGKDEDDDDENEKGSPDVARLESRLGEVLGLKTLVLAVKHNEMLGYRDSWIKARHVAQTEDVEWHMRYAYDDNMKQQLLERLAQRQTNEIDGAHIAYDRVLRVERAAVMEQAERFIQESIKMQEYLFGDSHPHVTDTVMISVRMYISREKLIPAISLLERVWNSRTGSMTAEKLPLGHPREKECSLYHVATTQWLAGNYATACTIFEALLKGGERTKRDLNKVWSLLTLCHVRGVSFEERLALAGQCVPWLKIVRPLDLSGSQITASDVLGRDPGIVPPTTMPPWRAVGQCLKVNKLLRVLDLSRTGLGAEGVSELEKGVRGNSSLCSLNLSNNAIGSGGACHLGEMIKGNGTITELDISGNNLEDAGLRHVAGGIALGNTCHNTALRRLCLADNGISPDGALTLSLALKVRAVRVVSLDMSANPLYDTGVTHVFDALFMGTPFVTLCVADCQFGLPGVVKMAEAVAASESLKVLDVSNKYKDEVGVYALGNRIDAMGSQVLADAVGSSHSVTSLDVSGNSIGPKGARSLCECLLPANIYSEIPNPERGFMGVIADWNDRETMRQRGSKGCLRSLKMRDCSLGSEAAQGIAKELGRNPALIGLDLCQSGIGGTGVASVAVALGSNPKYMRDFNTTLTSLNLQCCEAFASGATHVGGMLRANLFLRTLVFSDNAIGAEGATAIAEALKINEGLADLRLAKNTVGNRGAAALGEALRANRRLNRLDISLNSITDDGATALAQGLSGNDTLSLLDLSQNSFGAAGALYLSVAAKSRPVRPVDKGGGALRLVGVIAQDQVRELLPVALTNDRCQELLRMRRLS